MKLLLNSVPTITSLMPSPLTSAIRATEAGLSTRGVVHSGVPVRPLMTRAKALRCAGTMSRQPSPLTSSRVSNRVSSPSPPSVYRSAPLVASSP